jgi:PilZ domain
MMLSQSITLPSRRVAVRRAVQVECAVGSSLWDGSASYTATDLSEFGLWLSSPLSLEPGASVVLSFRPPRWPAWAWPVTAAGEVVRANVPRRRSDNAPAGMGVRFTEIDPGVAAHIALVLRGLPPPLPVFSVSDADVELAPETAIASEPAPDADHDLDAASLEFRAEAPLLTAGRPRPRALIPRKALLRLVG